MVASIPTLPFSALSHSGSRIISLLSSFLILPHLATSQSVYTTIVVTVAPPIPSDAPSFTDHDTFTSAILNSTNFYRTTYNASNVRWNSTLESFASSYLSAHASSKLKLKRDNDNSNDRSNIANASTPAELEIRDDKTCHMAHSGGPYGENLAIGCSDAASCVDMWGSEVSSYDYADPGFGESTGHFTQLVWRDTTDVGCGAVLCAGNGGWYLACEYWPRGNIIGDFKDEVGEKVSGAPPAGLGGGVRRRGGWGVVEGVVVLATGLAWWGLV
ncbi:PR-1-like protein [Annulohypoxylon truncatum]|uniref:PR-1-like protein n=1 Tax=Annulohypoxylon truncatum TaxID=327061 RepID=UPI00200803F0|nr:PR-1-like protein [Annulohypoxylon truncatum]KAI1205674.1 PR-1-like protein [Annulohypoxylon truncatum]